jgi:hypothetical protein
MTRQLALAAATLMFLSIGVGCVNCGVAAYGLAFEAASDSELPSTRRNKVHLFAFASCNPLDIHAVNSLGAELNRRGFAKFGLVPVTHASWALDEMRCIQKHMPDAVFVLLGIGPGATTAKGIADEARGSGLTIAALVLIDAAGRAEMSSDEMRVLFVCRDVCGGGITAPAAASESIVVPAKTRIGLVTDPRTVAGIVRLLGEIAASIPLPVVEEPPRWEYVHAPAPRPLSAPDHPGDWHFLFDQPGTSVRPIREWPAAHAAQP